MIAPSEQLGGKADDDNLDPFFEILSIKKEADAIRERLDAIDKSVGRLALCVVGDEEKNN